MSSSCYDREQEEKPKPGPWPQKVSVKLDYSKQSIYPDDISKEYGYSWEDPVPGLPLDIQVSFLDRRVNKRRWNDYRKSLRDHVV